MTDTSSSGLLNVKHCRADIAISAVSARRGPPQDHRVGKACPEPDEGRSVPTRTNPVAWPKPVPCGQTPHRVGTAYRPLPTLRPSKARSAPSAARRSPHRQTPARRKAPRRSIPQSPRQNGRANPCSRPATATNNGQRRGSITPCITCPHSQLRDLESTEYFAEHFRTLPGNLD